MAARTEAQKAKLSKALKASWRKRRQAAKANGRPLTRRVAAPSSADVADVYSTTELTKDDARMLEAFASWHERHDSPLGAADLRRLIVKIGRQL